MLSVRCSELAFLLVCFAQSVATLSALTCDSAEQRPLYFVCSLFYHVFSMFYLFISGLTSAVDDNDSQNSKLTVTGAAMAEKRRLFRLKVVFRLLASCPALVGSMFKNSLGDILDYTGMYWYCD